MKVSSLIPKIAPTVRPPRVVAAGLPTGATKPEAQIAAEPTRTRDNDLISAFLNLLSCCGQPGEARSPPSHTQQWLDQKCHVRAEAGEAGHEILGTVHARLFFRIPTVHSEFNSRRPTCRACSSILHPFLILPSVMCMRTPVCVHNLNAGHECPKRFRKRPICSKGRGMCQGRRPYQAAEPEGNTRWPYTVSNRAGNIVA